MTPTIEEVDRVAIECGLPHCLGLSGEVVAHSKELQAFAQHWIEFGRKMQRQLDDSQAEIAARDLMIKNRDAALSDLEYFIDNPSAWDGFSQNVSDAIKESCAVIAKSEHHNSSALEKRLLKAELSGLRSSVIELTIYREREILAKLAELNKE